MKLRYLIITTFCLVAVLPLLLFWAWPYSKALDTEYADVKERHLVIAKNLSAVVEHYYRDVTGVFSLVANLPVDQLNNPAYETLLENHDIKLLVSLNEDSNAVTCLYQSGIQCPETLYYEIKTQAMQMAKGGQVQLSPVIRDASLNSGPVFLMTFKTDSKILLGYLSTQYIVSLGNQISFGEKGHATIIDQTGTVIAHPLESWRSERRNLSGVSVVDKVLSGQTGIEKFYSPALEQNMIAGYAHVPSAGWGVMIPQPVSELEQKAQAIDATAIYVMLFGVGLALLITVPATLILTRPLDVLLNAIKTVERGEAFENLQWPICSAAPKEIHELKDSFCSMVDKINDNKKSITRLAYFDSITGLPNRVYFYKLASMALEKAGEDNSTGALVFIDFDAFKVVNDTYGHRVGDELLSLFSKNISDFFMLTHEEDDLIFFDSVPDTIPARLGGDEFVLLLQNVEDEKEVETIVRNLFKQAFSEYQLYGDIVLNLTGSAGIAMFPEHGTNYSELLKNADKAMYQAKATGKNKIFFAE